MHEHIPGLRTRTCGETLSQNRTECLHAPQTTCQRGEFSGTSKLLPEIIARKLCRFNVTVGLGTYQVSATNIRADLKV